MLRQALIVFASIPLLAASGCATRPVNPDAVVLASGLIVDGKGRDRSQVQRDGDECAGIASATGPGARAAGAAIAGAVVGALLGAIVYRGSGLSGNSGAGYGAALGGVSGGTSGAAAGAQDYRAVLRNCMRGRGHVTLN